MTRKKYVFLALAALVFALSSCSEYLSPVEGYLERYTEEVLILDHEITTAWAMDAEIVASVPSASPAILRFQLANSRNYSLEGSILFSDPDVEAFRTADSCRLALSDDRQSITLELSPEFLALHEGGGDLSATLTLTEA